MHHIRRTIRRHPRWKAYIVKETKDLLHYHPREAFFMLAAVVAAGVTFWPHDEAHSAVEISTASVMPAPYVVYDAPSSTTGPRKPIDPKMMGSYLTTVDLHYMAIHGNEAHMGASFAALLGVHPDKKHNNLVPNQVQVNWAQSLKQQWAAKLRNNDVSPATQKWAAHIVQSYANSPRDVKGIKTFVAEADTASKQMYKIINYGQMCHDFKISHCTQYYQTMGKISGVHIASYGMTEIFPSHDGQFNYVMLDTILRNAGENYLDSIPAGGDDLLSKGFYQFTSYAIRRDDSGLLGGVTKVDNYAGMKLSGSVVHLRTEDAHKAAYLFATYNIGQLIRTMNDKDANTLATKCPVDQITQEIAVSHHMPSKAWDAGRRWVHEGCKKPLSAYLNAHLREYAYKTQVNFSALKDHIT